MHSNIYTVTQVNNYIKKLLEKDIFLHEIFMQGEISNFKLHSSGHCYLTLKDENASINAIMYKGNAERLQFVPENGMKVTVFGYVSLYEKTGQYQIYLQLMEPAGKGVLYLAFEQLKNRLEKVGLFDEKHKKRIPEFPKCIAVITSPIGAAVKDIIQVINRRNPSVEVVVIPVLVQGDKAAADIARGIKLVNEWGMADTIIVGRGGGSIEDLWAFNEEIVARAIFDSAIPVISAVGHETDFTIADFISDMRAPTPSAAAELAVPEMKNLGYKLSSCYNRLNLAINNKCRDDRIKLDYIRNRQSFKNMLELVYNSQIYTYDLYKKLQERMDLRIEKNKFILNREINNLENLSPMNILKKGYSLAYNSDGNVISSVKDVKCGDDIKLRVYDGEINVRVLNEGDSNG